MIPDIGVPELRPLLEGADHVDVKATVSTASLPELVAGSVGWQPMWLRALFGTRDFLVRVLGVSRVVGPRQVALEPEDVSFTPGDPLSFFTVVDGDKERFLLLETGDGNFSAWLAFVAAEPVGDGRRYQAITIVKYHRRTGAVYFNLIRPFHHLVVRQMLEAGTRSR